MKSVRIVYENPKTKERRTETLDPKDPKTAARIESGGYVGALQIKNVGQSDSDERPVEFVVESEDGQGKARPPLTRKGTQGKTYWKITVRDFTGDQKQLFDVLSTHPKIATPIVSKALSERKLALGSLVLLDIWGDVAIIGNTVHFTFYRPPGTAPTRVWMKFPIEKDQVSAELDRYQQFGEFGLPKEIMKESPTLANEMTKLAPPTTTGSARWYEIPASKDAVSFRREFELDQIGAWQARGDKPISYLVVWQLDDGFDPNTRTFKDAQAYLIVADPVTKLKVAVKSEEAAGWPTKIKDAKAEH